MRDKSLKAKLDAEGICHAPENLRLKDLFFADTALERRPARNLCQSCPVRSDCLKWALENMQIWGVWGGCDEAELRRALWVNSNGTPTSRCRYPQCPNCKARPSKLFVVSICELRSSRRTEYVQCSSCNFSWQAHTSVVAVRAYWRDRRRQEKAKRRARRGAEVVATSRVG